MLQPGAMKLRSIKVIIGTIVIKKSAFPTSRGLFTLTKHLGIPAPTAGAFSAKKNLEWGVKKK